MSDLIQYQELSLEKATDIAKQMVNFIDQFKLALPIKGKKYIQVDGWQFLSIPLQLNPVIIETKDLSTQGEFKYQAICELRHQDQVVSTGVGLCSNKEHSKRQFDEYAVLSMAQTRAIGKAYRNRFGFIAKLAGYEATPAEEMTDVFSKKSTQTKDEPEIINYREKVSTWISAMKDSATKDQWLKWFENAMPSDIQKTYNNNKQAIESL